MLEILIYFKVLYVIVGILIALSWWFDEGIWLRLTRKTVMILILSLIFCWPLRFDR